MMNKSNTIAILDFGSQYTQLIARRVREAHVYSEIVPRDVTAGEIADLDPVGIILSGGPASVYAPDAYGIDQALIPAVAVPYIQWGITALAAFYNSHPATDDVDGAITAVYASGPTPVTAAPQNGQENGDKQVGECAHE